MYDLIIKNGRVITEKNHLITVIAIKDGITQAVATALGLFNFFGMGSGVVAPSVAGYIFDVFNTKVPAFYLAIAMAILFAFVFYFMNRKQDTNKF